MSTLQQLSILVCLSTTIGIMLRLRQTRTVYDTLGWIYRIALASLALAYLQKSWARMDGNITSPVEAWREISLLVVIAAKLIVGWREGRK
jgi:hypothetical protein